MSISIRPALPGDEATILRLVRSLAAYEKLLDQVAASEAELAEALFGAAPKVFCDIAETAGRAVGYALWFYNFSTFRGRHGIYLEDLFVEPEARGLGVGKALLARLARRCVDEKLARLEWAVLDWNAPAIGFYERNGAEVLPDWRICRTSGDGLVALAGSA